MKKILYMLLLCCLLTSLAACAAAENINKTSAQTTPAETEQPEAETATTGIAQSETMVGEKAMVAYFAYSENIGDTSGMSVDAITSASLRSSAGNASGNLQVMAQLIQEQTGADVFHILVKEPYAPQYEVMRERAYEELDGASFPELQAIVENMADYKVVYIGTPVWSGRMPRPVASFLKENDLSGKTIVPFGIHLGSGFGTILEEMAELAPKAQITDGFTINASTANDQVKTEFMQWMTKQ